MIRLLPTKRATEVRDYRHDWTPFLGLDTIQSQTTTGVGITVDSSLIEPPALQKIKFWLSGGVAPEPGIITQTIVTAGGRTETEIFSLGITVSDELVSVSEAKQNMKVENDDSENALIAGLIRSARAYVEDESGYVFVRRQFNEEYDVDPRGFIPLDRRPVVIVDEIEYTDDAYATQTITDSFLVLERGRGRVYPTPGTTAFPTIAPNSKFLVRYTAGYAEGSTHNDVELARQAILMLVAHWYAMRETASDKVTNEVPFGVRHLINRFRTWAI
jgi:uncharacterized phiE125 gp8 family phage protein